MVKQESGEFSTRTYRPFDVKLSILKRVSLVSDDHSMFDPSCYVQCKRTSDQDYESDGSLTWEDFFGTTVEISSGLMDMYDTLIRKDKIEEQQDKACTDKEALGSSGVNETANNSFGEVSPSYSNKTLHDEKLSGGLPATSSRERNILSRRSMSVTDTYHTVGKKRPLSTSSVSSSSSSSSSSLPRNGIDVKKSYLASIESLDDDDDVSRYGEGRTGAHCSRDQLPHARERRSLGSLSECGGSEENSTITSPSRQTSYDPNLGLIDRVILEIVDTERTYVKDLNEIIEGYLHHIQKSGNTKVSEQSLKDLFGNIEDIYRFNNTFLQDLEDCGLDPVAVARCFVKNSTGFVIYTQYCTNYPR
ncbi:pleckstrin homology domain-containing family G member 3-like [Limulus polyphemus]|uniref:Pleckstrin homology domain-containing family G member 3-like n=1 Tax=Limulus polyphemus TaxID=6850 RepID=A0ABM1BFK3_LIMPO|nr:pleckstrin homology domain-containing family G member 3-like [Limulus polyphemus]